MSCSATPLLLSAAITAAIAWAACARAPSASAASARTPTDRYARSGVVVAIAWPQTAMPLCCAVTGSTETVLARATPAAPRTIAAATTTTPTATSAAVGRRPNGVAFMGYSCAVRDSLAGLTDDGRFPACRHTYETP